MRAGDVVKHIPSGETWVLAYADEAADRLSWCGWPEGIARVSDCVLVKAASEEEHLQMVATWLDRPHKTDDGFTDSRVHAVRRLYRPTEAA